MGRVAEYSTRRIMNNSLKLYQQNQTLSTRLLDSITLYLKDIVDPSQNEEQHLQSKHAVLILLDAALSYMNDGLVQEVQDILNRIFTRTVYDVVRLDRSAINKDIKAFMEIRKIF